MITYKTLKGKGWQDTTPSGDIPYDAELHDRLGRVRIQIKMQRRRDGRPMMGSEVPQKLGFSKEVFVVETQKTRGGKRGGKQTRPYRFGDFDVLGVSLAPSTNDWQSFLYTVAAWLIPDPGDDDLILKYQPVPSEPNATWTDDLVTCIAWLRSGQMKRISTAP